jgi:lysophospholipase L1-like esterase
MRIENGADRHHRPRSGKWVASWAGAMQGPAPAGVPVAMPDTTFSLPGDMACDQTFRMIIRPDLWGTQGRLHFSNAFGDRPVSIDGVFVALHAGAGALVPGTTVPARFDGGDTCTILPGAERLSDPIILPFIRNTADPLLQGRKLAVSFHLPVDSGPMTWHAKAMTTSYLSPRRSGARGADETDAAFPFSTTAWYFLDGFDVVAPVDTVVVAGLGDSITDGTFSTLNGDDRWTDRLLRRLHEAYGARVSVVNLGIGGNQVIGPTSYQPAAPFNGGPSALSRLERDILSRPGLTHVIWVEGVNDFGQAMAPKGSPPAEAQSVIDGLRAGSERMRTQGVRVIGGTLPPSLNAARESYGTPEIDARRQRVNDFIRSSGFFDAVVDFEAATIDPKTGAFQEAFQPNTTLGGLGDRLHPNRAGYLAMGDAIDLSIFKPES